MRRARFCPLLFTFLFGCKSTDASPAGKWTEPVDGLRMKVSAPRAWQFGTASLDLDATFENKGTEPLVLFPNCIAMKIEGAELMRYPAGPFMCWDGGRLLSPGQQMTIVIDHFRAHPGSVDDYKVVAGSTHAITIWYQGSDQVLPSALKGKKWVGRLEAAPVTIEFKDDPKRSKARAFAVQALSWPGRGWSKRARAVGPNIEKDLVSIVRQEGSPRRDKRGAARVLGVIRSGEAAGDVIPWVSGSGDQSLIAIEALGGMGDARAVEPLMARLKTAETREHVAAILQALGRLKDQRALSVIESKANDSDLLVRGRALAAAQEIDKTDRASGLVKALLTAKSADRNKEKVTVLDAMGDSAIDALLEGLTKVDKPWQVAQLGELLRLRLELTGPGPTYERILAGLIKTSESEDWTVARAILPSLKARHYVIKALRLRLSRAGAGGLSEQERHDFREPLRDILRNHHHPEDRLAIEPLASLKDRHLELAIVRELGKGEKAFKLEALRVLSQWGTKASLQSLERLAKESKDEEVREGVRKASNSIHARE